MFFYEFFLVVLFGCFLASLASFFLLVSYRTDQEEPFVSGRSRCERCRRQIAWYDNLPLYSFVVLGGRCRNCHQPIPQTYFVYELLAFVSAWSVYWWPSIDLMTAAQFLVLFVLFFVGVADLRYLLVPDFFVVLLVLLSLVILSLTGANWGLVLISVGVALGFFGLLYVVAQRLLRREALGLGDIKLMVPLAMLLPWPLVVVQIFLAFISGGIFATLVLVARWKKIGQSLPFAPFLILSFVMTYIYGETIWQWYTGLIF